MNPKANSTSRRGRCAAAVMACAAAMVLAGPARAGEPLKFRHHFADRELPGSSWGQTAAADLDRDGRPDFITGRSRAEILWYRLEESGRWTRHRLGEQSPSDVGGAALDVDRDGWIDFVAGGAWYRNTGKPRTEPFERIVFDKDLGGVHDVVLADVDGDGRPDVLTMSDRNNLRWYRIAPDPRQPWQRHDVGPSVHAGIGAGDLDGDGDTDIVRSNLWYENADGRGTRWTARENIPFGNPGQPFPLATHCAVLDVDRDGDADLVMTENEIKAGRIAWLENADGKGGAWKLHELPAGDQARRGAYHSLVVADFDADGDPDVFTCEMEGIPGERPPRWFLWENLDGKGQKFAERVVLDANLGGHAAVAADFDGDGDLDIVSKLWRPRKDNANGGRNHVDFLENLLKASNKKGTDPFQPTGTNLDFGARPSRERGSVPFLSDAVESPEPAQDGSGPQAKKGRSVALLGGSEDAAAARDYSIWPEMEKFFTPPEQYRGKLGEYRSLMRFDDGTPVKTRQDWPRRRQEILRYWHGVMGPWPALIDKPRIKYQEKEHVENFTRHRVQVEFAPDRFAGAQYLLVPDGRHPEGTRLPAVVVTWYNSEDSAGLTEKARGRVDFGYQLAKRGFVTLCIGGEAKAIRADTAGPPEGKNGIQPLSCLAYAAANCAGALAAMPEVDPRRIGVVGHSFGGKWAMFASCLCDKFACAVWVDPGIVWNEKDPNANYWEKWYLGYEFDQPADKQRTPGVPREGNPRTGAYKRLVAEGRDLHELHALMAPRPFLVSGGAQDRPEHWTALNQTIALNEFLGQTGRVAMTMRDGHAPTAGSNAQVYAFFEHFLKGP